MCVDDDGIVTSFCVYDAPTEARVPEHATQLGAHTIVRVIEIAADIDPADIAA